MNAGEAEPPSHCGSQKVNAAIPVLPRKVAGTWPGLDQADTTTLDLESVVREAKKWQE